MGGKRTGERKFSDGDVSVKFEGSTPSSVASVSSKKSQMERNEKPVDVWWDMENAPVPYDCPDSEISRRILEKLKKEGFFGRVRIRGVVGYTNSLKKSQKKRIYEGRLDKKILKIKEVHKFKRPEGPANNQVAVKKISDIIAKWLKKGREPQCVMVFTGDNGFADVLEKLQKHGHTTLLACIENPNNPTSTEVRKFADYQWFWREFLSLPIAIPKKIRKKMEKKIRSKAGRKMKREAKMKKEAERKRMREAEDAGLEKAAKRQKSQLQPYVSQCPIDVNKTNESTEASM